ncbi:hypothetical protein L345_03687, partial [Ophiophagus hannah]
MTLFSCTYSPFRESLEIKNKTKLWLVKVTAAYLQEKGPSPVYDIEFANVTTTTLEIKWKDNDTNASNYTYQIYITGTNYFDNKTSNTPYVHVDGLEPGTLYEVEIYAEIDGNKGDPKDTSVYT